MDQVTLLPFSAPTALAALQQGSVDAALLPIPFNTQAVELGIGVKVIDTADIVPGEPQAFIIYGPTLLEQNPALGRRFMVAYLRGVQRYNEGATARNVAIIAKYIKIEPAIVQKGGWVDIHRDGFIDAAKIRRYQDWLFDIGLVNIRNPISTVVDTSFLEQALAALGIPQVR